MTRARDLVDSTNRERRGVAEADTTYVDRSAVGVHNTNTRRVMISGLFVPIHSHVVSIIPCMC